MINAKKIVEQPLPDVSYLKLRSDKFAFSHFGDNERTVSVASYINSSF